jgi:hypothetical protein
MALLLRPWMILRQQQVQVQGLRAQLAAGCTSLAQGLLLAPAGGVVLLGQMLMMG